MGQGGFSCRKELTPCEPVFCFIPFIFFRSDYGKDISSDAAANPPGQVKYAPVGTSPNCLWTAAGRTGEVLDKAAAGDFRANMLAGEYWMGLYYLNRGDLPLACLEHMQHFFRDAVRHPAIRHPSS